MHSAACKTALKPEMIRRTYLLGLIGFFLCVTAHAKPVPTMTAQTGPESSASNPPDKPIASQQTANTSLPKKRSGPPPFAPGESLSFDLDVMGVAAGTVLLEVQPNSSTSALSGSTAGELRLRSISDSSSFFKKMRRVRVEAVSSVRVRDLLPSRFHEAITEGETTRTAKVEFKEKTADVSWKSTSSDNVASSKNSLANEGLDYLSAIYLFRALPLKIDQTFSFDLYAVRRIWRVEGKIEGKEKISTVAGELDAFVITATATRIGGKPLQRQIQLWISDDAKRLPLAATASSSLGVMRATLASVERRDFKAAKSKTPMEW